METEHASSRMELWISYVLRGGVLLTGAIILVGVAMLIAQGPNAGNPPLSEVLRGGGREVAVSWQTLGSRLLRGSARAVIQIGLLVLILTPTARVALTLALFVQRREWLFVVLTALVLVILLLGLVGVTG